MIMLHWPVLLLVDAAILRILPGLEVDNWLAAAGAAAAMLLGTWPIAFLTNYIGLNSTWILLIVATAVYAVILTVTAALSTGLRSHSAVAVPFGAALIAGVNDYVAPAVLERVIAATHVHWF